MSDLPDYYAILEVTPTSTAEEIKRGYRRVALKTHPDRISVDSPQRASRTRQFQKVNDAYYVLSDPIRRRDYDDARREQGSSDSFDENDVEEEIPRSQPSAGGSSWANMFGFGKSATQEEQFADDQFKTAFEEMMGEEDLADGNRAPTKRFWSIAGGFAGAIIGFIGGDIVGAIPGWLVGSKLGAIRDAKGKSVYAVFQTMDQSAKARILSELAAKVLSGAIS